MGPKGFVAGRGSPARQPREAVQVPPHFFSALRKRRRLY
jgi:hypothetical protein